jgi:hypothetical protein
MDELIIHHQEMNEHGEGMWFVNDPADSNILAKLVYHAAGERRISLDSTVVSDTLRGRNVGKRLVNAAADYARNKQLKLIPVCPFVIALFEKAVQDYSDVAG